MAPDADRKPILLTVDDDPGVSRAVARDLRRQYGDDYRVIRTESGPQALETLRELKLRGDLVAVLLADHRMPDMSGLEFLEEAMDLFPHARRALLTAYADTDAAIQAINVVDLDHYLLKPWDPPEEKLYPVVDSLHRPVARDRRAGARVDPGGRATAGRPARSRSATSWPATRCPTAGSPATSPRAAAARRGRRRRHRRSRWWSRPRATTWSTPTIAELAEQRGPVDRPHHRLLRRRDRRRRTGRPRRRRVRRLRGPAHGPGRAARPPAGRPGRAPASRTTWASPTGCRAAQLTDRARRQAHKFGAEILTTRDVVGLDVRGSSRVVRFADGGEVVAHAVLLATGISYRTLDVPGRRGRSPAAACSTARPPTEAPACAGDDVYIVGGANSAGQAAVFLARHALRVTLLVRADSLERSMSHYLIRQIEEIPNIEVRLDTEVVEVHGDERLEGLTLGYSPPRQPDRGAGRLPVRVHRRRAPHRVAATAWSRATTGASCSPDPTCGPTGAGPAAGARPRPLLPRGERAGVFAAGDVRANSVKRVASAVGEGAMAIQLIHGYLERQ